MQLAKSCVLIHIYHPLLELQGIHATLSVHVNGQNRMNLSVSRRGHKREKMVRKGGQGGRHGCEMYHVTSRLESYLPSVLCTMTVVQEYVQSLTS